MDIPAVRVSDKTSLLQAIDERAAIIAVDGRIAGLNSISLAAGTRLHGIDEGAELSFEAGRPGLMLTKDNEVAGLRLVTDETQIALGLTDEAEDLGVIRIADIAVVGRVHLESGRAKVATLRLDNVHVERADARLAAHRPAGYGVEVLIGCLSIYNSSKDPASRWTVEARNLSGGSEDRPLRGSGVFVFGGWFIATEADPATTPAPEHEGGSVDLRVLTTGEIHVDGGIPAGTGDLITGGVFVGSGVHGREVVNEGAVTTYGQNDMVLDNWGTVGTWVAKGGVSSFGSSGIGFVNFGEIGTLTVEAPITTHGLGARGFNLYDGTLRHAEFESITTHGDGAIGIQLSRPFGTIVVRRDVRTTGGEGNSLVRGKVVCLKAFAFSVKPGTKGDRVTISGEVVAENPAISTWDFKGPASAIGRITVGGEVLDRTPT